MEVEPVEMYTWLHSKDLDELHKILRQRSYHTTFTTRPNSVPTSRRIYKELIARGYEQGFDEILEVDSDNLHVTLLPKEAIIKLPKEVKELTRKDMELYDFIEERYPHILSSKSALALVTLIAGSMAGGALASIYFGVHFP